VAKSYVLKALRIFGLEEMLKLSKSALVKPVMLKKAAGEDLIVWSDASEEETQTQAKAPEETLGVVLPFKKQLSDFAKITETGVETKNSKEPPLEASSPIYSSEFILWNKELNKETSVPASKKEAAREYARSAEMYVVKTSTVEGKDKIRFASTNGVLVDKKQA
jgi:hypothetical protein